MKTAKEILNKNWAKHYIYYHDSLIEQITVEAMEEYASSLTPKEEVTSKEIFEWLEKQGYQTDYEETGEYKMYLELDMPKIINNAFKHFSPAEVTNLTVSDESRIELREIIIEAINNRKSNTPIDDACNKIYALFSQPKETVSDDRLKDLFESGSLLHRNYDNHEQMLMNEGTFVAIVKGLMSKGGK